MTTGDWYLDSLLADRRRADETRQYATVPKVDVVKAKAVEYADRIKRSTGRNDSIDKSYIEATPFIALQPVVVVPPVAIKPEHIFPTTIVPLAVRAPTARLVSDEFHYGEGSPWSTAPASLVLSGATIGSLLVYFGKQVAAQMAISGGEQYVEGLKKRYNRRDVQFRVQTGNSPAGKGNVVRPRGEGGEVPEGTDPYEDPDDYTWFKPWTWF